MALRALLREPRRVALAARLAPRPCRGGGCPFLSGRDPVELWLPLDARGLRQAAAADHDGLALAVTVLTAAGWRGR